MTRCTECDKPLLADEARECSDACFACERERAIGRLAWHVQQGRITAERVREMVAEATAVKGTK